jgi:ABC-type antimicrobial peptide transport system permease subunit
LPNAQQTPEQEGRKAKTPEENQDRFVNVVLVRTTGDAARTITSIQSAISSLDANLPLLSIATIQQQLSDFISHDELISRLSTAFSILALLLASIGLYGVMSYNVERRRAEIGVRIALGAQVSIVRWMVLRESLLLLGTGVLLGLPLTLAFKGTIKHQLFGLSPLDPLTYVAAVSVVTAMTFFASWLPAYRASKMDPILALRNE